MLKDSTGDVVTVNSTALHGITTCNVPIGAEEFVKGYLEQQIIRIISGSDTITELLDLGRWPHSEIPS